MYTCPLLKRKLKTLQTFKSLAVFGMNHLFINEKKHRDDDITILIDRD